MAPIPDSKPPLAAIFMLSGSALAYEILLVRLFAIMHWHHFAFMVISVALLGYGASGSFISILRHRLLQHFEAAFALNGLLFGLSTLACFMLAQQLSFNTLEILWDPGQWLRLLLVYLLLSLPFFFVANAIALGFTRFPRQIAKIYGVDLIAAGIGALLVMLLLESLPPTLVLRLISVSALVAVLFYPPARTIRWMPALVATAILLPVAVPGSWIQPAMSPYKGLSQALQVKDARQLQRIDSARSRIDVVASESVPFRHAPGLSLLSPSGPPPQLGVFSDGDRMQALDRGSARDSRQYLAYMSSALPYFLRPDAANVLLLNAGAGQALQQARWFNVPRIDVVEVERRLSELYRKQFSSDSGFGDNPKGITHHHLSARAFVAGERRFDLVLMGPSGASAGSAAGVDALVESYDLTVEGITSSLERLKQDGMIGITLWNDNPPRANPRLFATAVKALRRAGIDRPGNHLAWIRAWNTATLIIARAPFNTLEQGIVRDFATSRNFDLAWLAGLDASEVNRYQQLPQPLFYLAARALLGLDEAEFIDSYPFDIRPVSDDRPYFNLFFRWPDLGQIRSLPAQTTASLTGLGYPTLLVTIAQALVAALLLILVPLVFLEKRGKKPGSDRFAIASFFLAIGLAYLFIEITFIQRFTLVLDHPLLAVSVTLGSFLVFSGLGSLYVQWRLGEDKAHADSLLTIATVTIALMLSLYLVLTSALNELLLGLDTGARLAATIALCAPLAFLMGMPFTLGLARLEGRYPALIPWAWGINGCASVLSAMLAVLLAVHQGFSVVIMSAGALYLLALLASRGFSRD